MEYKTCMIVMLRSEISLFTQLLKHCLAYTKLMYVIPILEKKELICLVCLHILKQNAHLNADI